MRNMIFLLVLFVANVVQAVTGFAGTLLAMPPAMMLIGVHEAKVILTSRAVINGANTGMGYHIFHSAFFG